MSYWKDSLLVGVTKIDEQHKELVTAIDKLMAACAQGKGRATIEQTLNFVISYTKEHFKEEEALQLQYKYPDRTTHKRLHNQFISSISELMKDFNENGPGIALTGKINKVLVDWLIRHISIEDKKFGEYINNT